MIEDELLKWRFKHGSKDALRRIYEKYLNHLLTLAMTGKRVPKPNRQPRKR